jgi:hypothetical protein
LRAELRPGDEDRAQSARYAKHAPAIAVAIARAAVG